MKKGILNGNLLKLLALAAMTADHAAILLFNNSEPLRVFGRLSFPIFAYMIAEGCRYTKNRVKYILQIVAVAALCQTVYYITDDSLYMCVLVTFSLSIAIIFAIDYARAQPNALAWLLPVAAIAAALFLCEGLPALLVGTDYRIDYGFGGVMLAVLISLSDKRQWRLALCAAGMLLLCIADGGRQWWSLLALLPLALYNGKRGRLRMKYLFYIYYPAHLAVLYFIAAMT